MESLEALLPIGAIQIGLGLLALILLFGAWMSGRKDVEPLGYWPLAWCVLVSIGAIRVMGGGPEFEYSGGAFFCAFVLAGAYRYAGRPVPSLVFPIAAGAALLPLVFAQTSLSPIIDHAVVVLVPITILSAAAIVQRAVQRRNASALHRLIPLGLLAVAILGVYDHVFLGRGVDSIRIWLLVTIPIAANQAMAVFDRMRDRAYLTAVDLERSVSLLQATLESTADGILVVDRDGKYMSHNTLFRSMWGIPDEIIETGISEQVLQFAKLQLKDPDEFYRTVKEIYETPEIESFDTLDFKDGRCFERYSRPQTVGDKIVGRVWSFRDVTARNRAEETILRDRDNLEELVSERTRELVASRDHLRQADRMAAVGTLAAGVAHQINNPVGAILNSAEYALHCADDDDAMKTFHEALLVNAEEAKRCGAIVRGMLQFAREDPVEKIDEDLNGVTRRALRAVDSYAQERGAKVEIQLDEAPLRVRMGPLEMEQVVVNLLRNAIESRREGAIVSVSSGADDETAYVKVSDNGAGIDEQDQVRIFDPFFSTRLLEGGTGLGLSVAHGIVTDHGGEIVVDTSPENGTTITVEMPLIAG